MIVSPAWQCRSGKTSHLSRSHQAAACPLATSSPQVHIIKGVRNLFTESVRKPSRTDFVIMYKLKYKNDNDALVDCIGGFCSALSAAGILAGMSVIEKNCLRSTFLSLRQPSTFTFVLFSHSDQFIWHLPSVSCGDTYSSYSLCKTETVTVPLTWV